MWNQILEEILQNLILALHFFVLNSLFVIENFMNLYYKYSYILLTWRSEVWYYSKEKAEIVDVEIVLHDVNTFSEIAREKAVGYL